MTPQQTIENEPTRTQAFGDWMQANSRLVGIGAAVIAVAAAGFWFYMRSAEIKRQNAERGLNQAKQSLAAGNAALAETDLLRVANRYKGTPAGAQSVMLLAQLRYDEGEFQEGIDVLAPYTTAAAADRNLSAIWSLTGDGQAALNKPEEAASSYQKAADATTLTGEKSVYLAKSGRALMAAGKNAEAKAIWERLIADPDAALSRNEAGVRLGELMARPAGKS